MNILPLIDENISITLDYYNLSKLLYEEFINYMKFYKVYTNQYFQKITALYCEFENKLIKYKNESNPKINSIHIFQLIKIIPDATKKQVVNYFPIFENIETFADNFNKLINEKIIIIKNHQDKYNEIKKNFITKKQEVENFKTLYFNKLSQTEDLISEYFNKQKIIEENKEKQKCNKKINMNISFEQNKKLGENINNLIKETKNIEKNYISSIDSLKVLQNNLKELSNQLINQIKLMLHDMSNNYQKKLIEIMGLLKASYQVPLNLINFNIVKFEKSKEKESIDELLDNLYNKNISTMNIFPQKYKLKLLNYLNNNNDNIFSMSSFEEDINEKSEDDNGELSENILFLIKIMYQNFSLLSNHKINLQLEEEKIMTNKILTKLFLNIEALNIKKMNLLKKDLIFNEEDSNKLEKLLDKKQNRTIFLKKLNKFRSQSRFQLSIEYFILIGKFFNKILSFFDNEKDYNIVKNCIILSQTYYYLYENKKIYLKAYIEKHSIFKDPKIWDNLINILIQNEMKNKLNKIYSNNGYSNIAFGILYTFIDTMFEFDINEEDINKIIEPKIEMYKLDNNYKEDIHKLIINKIENKKINLSEEKSNYTILMEIIEQYENNINQKEKNSLNKDENKISN